MPSQHQDSHYCQLRLLLEEVCCDLCLYECVPQDECQVGKVSIDREFYLGIPGAFADIRVVREGQDAYFVEVKHGYSTTTLLKHLHRKYGPHAPAVRWGKKLVLVVDLEDRPDWAYLEAELPRCLAPGLEYEIWDEQRLRTMMQERFQTDLQAVTAESLVDVRQAIDRAKGFEVFGGSSLDEYEHDTLKAQLLWHFSSTRLKQLRKNGRSAPRDIFPPGTYRGVAVLMADLCSFSSYVRDTPDNELIRECLTSFYSKARYQIINNGGMFYQFVGDEVIGLFGVPESDESCAERALTTALTLADIGKSISNHWQGRIDRAQNAAGLHMGLSIGELQIVSLRPFSRTHIGAIGDCLNVAARLMAIGSQSEIVTSNSFYRRLPENLQTHFCESEPAEAKNVGRIKAWKLSAEQRDIAIANRMPHESAHQPSRLPVAVPHEV